MKKTPDLTVEALVDYLLDTYREYAAETNPNKERVALLVAIGSPTYKVTVDGAEWYVGASPTAAVAMYNTMRK